MIRGNCFCSALLVGAVLSVGGSKAHAQSPDEVAAIQAALPAKPTVQPAKPRKVLVFSLALGFKHASIPYGEKAFEEMGKKSGAFTATLSRDVLAFEPENLKQFDAVIFNNTTGELFTTYSLRTSLMDFAKGGKGVVGIHAASDTNFEWADFGKLIGGYFNGHPWNADSNITLKIEEPRHPVNAAFGGKGFSVTDEIYQFKEPYSRFSSRVLVSLDATKTDMTKKGMARPDKDYPVSWVHSFGKGRVFYCSLGHNKEIYANSTVLKHYLDGIQFALGDLKADATPRKDEAISMLNESVPEMLAGLSTFEQHVPNRSQRMLEVLVQQAAASPSMRRLINKRLAEFVVQKENATSSTFAARQFALQQLMESARDEDAANIAPALYDEDQHIADLASKILGRIPGRSAGQKLIEALGKTSGVTRVSVIDSLGHRKEAAAVKNLAVLARDGDASIAAAAISALGKIGTIEAARALENLSEASSNASADVAAAQVRAAGELAAKGNQAQARSMYQQVLKGKNAPSARQGALRGLVALKGSGAREVALEALMGNDAQLREIAIGALLRPNSIVSIQDIVQRLPKAAPDAQVQLIEILAARGDNAAMKPLVTFTTNETSTVRVAALRALGAVGDGSVVGLLAKAAASGEPELREPARQALLNLKPASVDIAILESLRTNDAATPAITAELVAAAGERRIKAAVPELLKIASSGADKAQVEAVKALALVADARDIEALVGLLPSAKTNRLRTEIEKALTAAVKGAGDAKQQAEAIDAMYAKASDDDTRASLLRVLGAIPDERTLARLRQARAEASSEKITDAAVRALSDYPAVTALPDVREIARTSPDEVHRGLALQGFARLLSLKKDSRTTETLSYCEEALELAKNLDQKRMVLGALGEVDQPGVLQLIMPYMGDAELKTEAQIAALSAARSTYAFTPDDATSAVQSIIDSSQSDERKKRAERVLANINETSDTLLGWQVAGPFTIDEETTLGQLMEEAFAPEGEAETSASVEWRLVAAGKNRKHPEMVDLESEFGGDNRVAYMRMRMWSPDERKARLLVGSDDAVRVWLNEDLVHKYDQTRAHKRSNDKVNVTLREGWNYLMLKVGQAGAGWGASAILHSPSGDKMVDVKTDALMTEWKPKDAGLPPAETASVEPAETASVTPADTVSTPSEQAAGAPSAQSDDDGWKALFNGTDLDGWEQRGGKATYSVENGELVGTSAPDTPNSFLCTKDRYENFVLELECKLDGPLNSGIQIRSNSRPEKGIDRVYGYQIEVDPSERAWSGGFYEEGGRKWLYDLKNNEPARKAFKLDGWNKYRIEAVGDTFRTWVNDVQCVVAVDSLTTSGFIGLQVHSTTSTVPISVRWRNIRLQELEQPAATDSLPFSGDWKSSAEDAEPLYAQILAQGNGELSATLVSSIYARVPALAVADGRESDGKVTFAGAIDAVLEGNQSFKGRTESGLEFDMQKINRLSPTLGMAPPEGAVVLFDGSNLDQWQKANGQPAAWKIVDGKAMEVAKKSGSIQTRKGFGDAQIHLEFRTPFMPEARGQKRGNSGIYVQGGYEIQILDSYGLEGKDNECGGIYKVGPPRINMCLPPMEWQTYDIVFEAAKLGADGTKTDNARLTVLHNGVCIHARSESAAPTPGGLLKEDPKTPMPIMLQDHGNPVQFRNVWAVDLPAGAAQLAASPRIIK